MKEKELDKAIRVAKKQAELKRINRRSGIENANEIISFGTRKLSAASLVGIGGLELLSPDVIAALQMVETSSIAAVTIGLGILGGKQLADALKRLSGGDDNE